MQNFRIFSEDDPMPEPVEQSHLIDDLGERISFINCASGLLIAYPADDEHMQGERLPVCLGVL